MSVARAGLPESVNLGGTMCRVQESEGLVVFAAKDDVWSTHYRIAFERRAGCWYVVPETSGGGAMVAHIVRAFEIVRSVYGGDFDYNGRPPREHQP